MVSIDIERSLVMLTFWTLILIFMTIAAHELGHAWAMGERGVPVKTISLIGISWPSAPWWLTWRLPIKSSRFPGTEWMVTPIIIGAYVLADEKAMENAPTRDVVYISAMGPIASVLIGIVLMGFARLGSQLDISGISMRILVEGVILFGTIGMIWVFRDWVARWICPVMGITIFVLVLIVMYTMGVFNSLVGPIGLVALIAEHASSASEASTDMAAKGLDYFGLWEVAALAGLISILIGITNLLPFLPLDGGHIMQSIMPQSWQRWHMCVSGGLFILLIIIAFTSDFIRIFS
jgi:membrane-associated protease RseP (regulator of RpoE activity)